ncbi:MAG: LacI family DNA-binding transcriptional regulator, partial [Chitinophagaceae bacterium]
LPMTKIGNKPPTIKQLARQLDVSVSTVSRALSNHPRIGLVTTQRVQQLAKELGYEPNSQAIFFKQNRTFIIGVVLPDIQEAFFSQAITGIEAAATLHHYTMLFGQSYDDLEIEKRIVGVMRKQRVDGLIISLSKQTNTYNHLKAFEKYSIPIVYFDRVPTITDVHKVYCDLYHVTIEMVTWFFNKGYKRIGLINGPGTLAASSERLKGYIEGVGQRKLKVDMQLVETTDLSKKSTIEAMKKLLALKNPPQVIISFNEYVHMDAVQFAKQLNIKVNTDVLFASYANLPMTAYTSNPPVVSVEQYPYKQGEKAMEMMMRLLQNKNDPGSTDNDYHIEILPASLILQGIDVNA